MKLEPELLKALAALLWPILAIIVVLILWHPIGVVLQGVAERGGTVEGGVLKVSVAAQQNRSIGDAQLQIAELLGDQKDGGARQGAVQRNAARLSGKSLLWVDDDPGNNAAFIERLRNFGVQVTLAESTKKALTLYGQRSNTNRFNYIITDMWRDDNDKAGLELIRTIRRIDKEVEIVVFCGEKSYKKYAASALGMGANGVTMSETQVLAYLIKQ